VTSNTRESCGTLNRKLGHGGDVPELCRTHGVTYRIRFLRKRQYLATSPYCSISGTAASGENTYPKSGDSPGQEGEITNLVVAWVVCTPF